MPMRCFLAVLTALLLATPIAARDSLGVFGQWGAFRDPEVPRCYAIAAAEGDSSSGYATVGTWPSRGVRGQVHLRLSREPREGGEVRLSIAGQRFVLDVSGKDAFAPDRQADARIVAAMRSSPAMRVSGRDERGRAFTDAYSLDGAATAIDATMVGCSRDR